MSTLRNAAIAAVLALTVSTGWAVLDGTAQGQSLRTAFDALSTELRNDAGRSRRIARLGRSVQKVADEPDFAREVAAAAHVAREARSHFGDQHAFARALEEAAEEYRLDLVEARAILGLCSSSGEISPGLRRRAGSLGSRLDEATPQPLDLQTMDLSESYARLARAARAAAGFAPTDGDDVHYVLSGFSPSTEPSDAVDLDGDGVVDGGADLSAFGLDFSAVVVHAQSLMPRRPALVLWNLDDAGRDSMVMGGVTNVTGEDTGVFEWAWDVDRHAHPRIRAVSSIAGGRVALTLEGKGDMLAFGSVGVRKVVLRLATSAAARRRGRQVPTQTIDGIAAMAIGREFAVVLATAEIVSQGLPMPADGELEEAVAAAADLDLDDDGVDESLSAVVRFRGEMTTFALPAE